jgi:small subunit ribosomal protein S5
LFSFLVIIYYLGMTPENTTPEEETLQPAAEETVASTPTTEPSAETSESHGKFDHKGGRGRDRNDRHDRGDRKEKPKKEFDELLLEVRRVTRVTTGGRRMSFRATILVGNKKGKIGLGVSKGNDVAGAVSKATNEAYKALFEVPITKGDTVPYAIELKYKSSRVRLLPASQGTGLKAGSSIRSVLELAGYSNILSKMIGSNNKLNNALATIQALASYKHADYFSGLREVKEEETTSEKAEPKAGKKEEKADTIPAKTAEAPAKADTSVAPKEEPKKEKKPVVKKPLTKKPTVEKE